MEIILVLEMKMPPTIVEKIKINKQNLSHTVMKTPPNKDES